MTINTHNSWKGMANLHSWHKHFRLFKWFSILQSSSYIQYTNTFQMQTQLRTSLHIYVKSKSYVSYMENIRCMRVYSIRRTHVYQCFHRSFHKNGVNNWQYKCTPLQLGYIPFSDSSMLQISDGSLLQAW